MKTSRAEAIVAFPTTEQKKIARGEEVETRRLYYYWTNFERYGPKEYQILTPDEFAATEAGQGFWQFKTNISPDDFDFIWDDARKLRFIKTMWEIYRYRGMK